MTVLKVQFRGRKKPVFLPVTEESRNGLINHLQNAKPPIGFVELTGFHEQEIWLNLDHVQVVNILFEREANQNLPFNNPKSILESRQRSDGDYEPDWDSVTWRTDILISGKEQGHKIGDLSGHDWITITTSIEQEMPFFVLTDDDGEEVGFRIDDIEVVIGIEEGRYSESQLEKLSQDIARNLYPEDPTTPKI
ncbi:MAG: hypothetical protein Q8N18_24380 [Opitutaceae bacterium]|nr:hypothetical protein [Opitutaceae bacterium]